MDVHLRSTTVCALDAETGEAVTRRFRGNPWGEVAEWMSGFPGPSLAAYESGYLGFAPQRELSGLGVDCVVAAVSKVPRSAADLSSKNDRNDAARMAKAILSHDVTPVWVPSPEIEGLRDLAGAHDAATARLAAAKQRRNVDRHTCRSEQRNEFCSRRVHLYDQLPGRCDRCEHRTRVHDAEHDLFV